MLLGGGEKKIGFGSGNGFGGRGAPAREDVSTPSTAVTLYEEQFITKDDEQRYRDAREKVTASLKDMTEVLAKAGASDPDQPLEASRDEIKNVIAQIINQGGGFKLDYSERERLAVEIAADIAGHGPIEPLLADDEVSEIMVNTHNAVYIEKRGQKYLTGIKFPDEASLLKCATKMAERVSRKINIATPICDARLPDGSRINIVIPPVAVEGTQLTIRKFRKERLLLKDLVNLGSMPEEASEVLRIIGRSRINALFSGGPGSGKTTLLNCVSGSINADERIIVCEDTAELQLQQPHVVRLETRPKSSEGTAEVTMSDLVRTCLRMKPDRIIVGEVRGPEAIDLIQAMNTGLTGSMSTVHANDPRGALSRLESCMRQAPGWQNQPSHILRKDIAHALDIIIQTEQLPSGKRIVTSISEVGNVEGDQGDIIILQELFRYDFHDHQLKVALSAKPYFYAKAERMGEQAALMQALQRGVRTAA